MLTRWFPFLSGLTAVMTALQSPFWFPPCLTHRSCMRILVQPALWKRLHSLEAFYEDVPSLELVLSMVASDVSHRD